MGYVPDLAGLNRQQNPDLAEVLSRNFDLISRALGGGLGRSASISTAGSSGSSSVDTALPRDRVETMKLSSLFTVSDRVAITRIDCETVDAEVFLNEGATLVEIAG
jgi:hypothetical protein